MTTRDALLRAVLDDPADDGPRLVLADWLEENGQTERAEFIRVQCKLEPLRGHGHSRENPSGGDCTTCLKVAGLERRERMLWNPRRQPPGYPCEWFRVDGCACHCPRNKLLVEWTAPGNAVIRGADRPGFVDAVSCRCEDWERHGPALVRAQPVRVVRTEKRPVKTEGLELYTWSCPVLPDQRCVEVCDHEHFTSMRRYHREGDALDALSRALIAFAKAHAEVIPT